MQVSRAPLCPSELRRTHRRAHPVQPPCHPTLTSSAGARPTRQRTSVPARQTDSDVRTASATEPQEADSMAASSGPSSLAKLQQNVNVGGIGFFLEVVRSHPEWAIPHLSIPDITSLNWSSLRSAGFKAVVFDKDNTLTRPFELQLQPGIQDALSACRKEFGEKSMALYSNSAGLEQYDPQGHEAQALESALGIHVLRHKQKKPSGGAAEVAQHFGCSQEELVMIGDRYLTDVVFGNRHGMLTVRPKPFVTDVEPLGVRLARRIEDMYVSRCISSGVKPPTHALVEKAGGAETFLSTRQQQ